MAIDKSLNELQKITQHLAKINSNDKTIKEIANREFKKGLKNETKKTNVTKLIEKIKPEKSSLTTKGIIDVIGEGFKYAATDELEDFSKIQIITQENILAENIITSLWLRDIYFIMADMNANIDKLTEHLTGFATFAFGEKRRKEETQRIQEERNRLIQEQTDKLGDLLETKQKVVSPEKTEKSGFFGKLFKSLGNIPTKIGLAMTAVFGFFKLGKLVTFFKNLKIVKHLKTIFTKGGGILKMIFKGIFNVIGVAFAFAGGFNIGTKISDFIDEKIGLGKGGLGKWIFNVIHSEEGLFGTLWNKLSEFAIGLKDGIFALFDRFPEIWENLKTKIGEIGSTIKTLMQDFGIWDFFQPVITGFSDLYKTFEPDLIMFKDKIFGLTDKIGSFIGNTSFEIVDFFSKLIDKVLKVKDDIVNKLIEVKDKIFGFITNPVKFIKNLFKDDQHENNMSKADLEKFATKKFGDRAKLLTDDQLKNYYDNQIKAEKNRQNNIKELNKQESFKPIKNRKITELAKREALRDKFASKETTKKQVNNNTFFGGSTSIFTSSDMETDMNESTFKQLRYAN